jgi:hypothetical protein
MYTLAYNTDWFGVMCPRSTFTLFGFLKDLAKPSFQVLGCNSNTVNRGIIESLKPLHGHVSASLLPSSRSILSQ